MKLKRRQRLAIRFGNVLKNLGHTLLQYGISAKRS